MDCKTHRRPFQYMCKAASCDLTLLCSQCRKEHLKSSNNDRSTHSAQIIFLKQAFQEAERNIKLNLQNLKQIIMPFENEQQISEKIRAQKEKLIQQRDRIIQQVHQVFRSEINELQGRNQQNFQKSKNTIPLDKIKERIDKLEDALRMYKFDPKKLKESLEHSQEHYINELRRNTIFSSMNIQTNEYFIYDDTKHDFFLARLQLKRKVLNNKLLQKVYNESDLYFLIDNYKQGNFLHYFSSGDNMLRILDLETTKWKQVRYESGFVPNYASTLYQPTSGRFYSVGGQNGNKKCNSIIWYSRQQNWKSVEMITGRSSAMSTLIYDDQGNHYIVIVGGVGADKKHLKSCELFIPEQNRCIPICAANFAVTSGCLVTFNKNIVIRIGGLGQFKPNIASICEIPEKCDFSEYLKKPRSSELKLREERIPKWTYLDLQVVNRDPFKKYNLFYAHQSGIQINPNEIFIFGGITHNSQGVQQSYIIEIQKIRNKQNRQSIRYYARWINQKPLISAQGFSGLRPIIYDKRIMSLQNISCGQSEIYQKQKRLIEFDMYKWKEIQNIVNI